jgi:hypothetical protein
MRVLEPRCSVIRTNASGCTLPQADRERQQKTRLDGRVFFTSTPVNA